MGLAAVTELERGGGKSAFHFASPSLLLLDEAAATRLVVITKTTACVLGIVVWNTDVCHTQSENTLNVFSLVSGSHEHSHTQWKNKTIEAEREKNTSVAAAVVLTVNSLQCLNRAGKH